MGLYVEPPSSPSIKTDTDFIVCILFQTGAEKTKLLSHKDLLVDRAGLLKALSQASKHGPLKLLHGVIRLVFTPETLANSCGKGIRKTVTGKPPLDTEKCNDCEGK